MTKIAIIINQDSEARHLSNVENSLTALEKQGYETHVFSTQKPGTKPDHLHVGVDKAELHQKIADLKSRVTANDEVLVYTTGHGGNIEEAPTLCDSNQDCSDDSIFTLLHFANAKQNIIVMDQCYSGGLAKLFSQSPNTLFVSAGTGKEIVVCQNFSPNFWSESVTDFNRDGLISWRERYQFALQSDTMASTPQFLHSAGFDDIGKADFPAQTLEVSTKEEMDKQLSSLKPGQYAFVTFSATWCGPCKEYKPLFDKFAQESNGQYLFIRTENEDLAREHGAKHFPTIKLFSGPTHSMEIKDRENLLDYLVDFEIPLAERLQVVLSNLSSPDTAVLQTGLDGVNTVAAELSPEQACALMDKINNLLKPQEGAGTIDANILVRVAQNFYYLLPRIDRAQIAQIQEESLLKMKSNDLVTANQGIAIFYCLFLNSAVVILTENLADLAKDIISLAEKSGEDSTCLEILKQISDSLLPALKPEEMQALQRLQIDQFLNGNNQAIFGISILLGHIDFKTNPRLIPHLMSVLKKQSTPILIRVEALSCLSLILLAQEILKLFNDDQLNEFSAICKTILLAGEPQALTEIILGLYPIFQKFDPKIVEASLPALRALQSHDSAAINHRATFLELDYWFSSNALGAAKNISDIRDLAAKHTSQSGGENHYLEYLQQRELEATPPK